ncbi:MAG: DUF3078 domain-containing protein [Flaviramulus sp.]|nr:DUF3078 domain-containing protein [Flaviramulus sp.]NNC49425.1 DUF3078 domain-containing protein [Flaviramulus sp.]
MKKVALFIFLLAGLISAQAQTLEELRATLEIQKDSLKAVQDRVKATQSAIYAFPGWKKGVFGTIGGSFTGFNNWYGQKTPNNRSGNIGFTGNAYANFDNVDYFWRNAANINLSWVKFDNKDTPKSESEKWREAKDVFNITSLYGHKFSDILALSGLGEYRTTILTNYNNPGYLDAGIGATITPIQDLVVVLHPLNYNLILSRNNSIFQSSYGTKILIDYSRQIQEVSFKTNLSMFRSYKSSDLSNWTWNNSLSYSLWKMIGVGFDFGLRSNKQEALKYNIDNYDVTSGNPIPTLETVNNKLQTFYTLGLSYKF